MCGEPVYSTLRTFIGGDKVDKKVVVNKNVISQSSSIEMKKKTSLFKRMNKHKMFYLFIAPFFILFLTFSLFPIIASFFLGFTEWNGMGTPEWVGFENYVRLFHDPIFIKSLLNTLYIWFFSSVLTLGLAFILAYMVNYYIKRAKGFYRVVFLFPLLVAPALTAVMISVIFSTNSGVMNLFLSFFMEGDAHIEWLRSETLIKPLIVLIVIWRWTGYHFILFLAGLQTISSEVYEAAKIDGASGAQIMRKITLPLMLPIIMVSVLTATVGGIQTFDEPYVLTQGSGGTNDAGLSMAMYLYQNAFEYFDFGMASAQSYILFAIILLFTLINSRYLRNRT